MFQASLKRKLEQTVNFSLLLLLTAGVTGNPGSGSEQTINLPFSVSVFISLSLTANISGKPRGKPEQPVNLLLHFYVFTISNVSGKPGGKPEQAFNLSWQPGQGGR